MAVIGHETLIQAAHDGTLMLLMLPNLSKNVFLPICFSCFCVCCLHINVFLGCATQGLIKTLGSMVIFDENQGVSDLSKYEFLCPMYVKIIKFLVI